MPCEIALGPLAIRFSLWLRYGRKRNAHKPVQRLAPSREWPSLWKPPPLERTAPLPPYRWIFRGRISPAFPGQSHADAFRNDANHRFAFTGLSRCIALGYPMCFSKIPAKTSTTNGRPLQECRSAFPGCYSPGIVSCSVYFGSFLSFILHVWFVLVNFGLFWLISRKLSLAAVYNLIVVIHFRLYGIKVWHTIIDFM